MMIRAKHHIFWTALLNMFTRIRIGLHFKEIKFHGKIPSENIRPLLIIGNHFSWWDGFIVQYINLKFLKKQFFVMMLEEELRQRVFLSKAGAFSIQPASRSMLESFRYASEILQDANNLLLIYPQGKIQSMHQRPLVFARGWTKILEDCKALPAVLFIVVLPEYGSHPKPTLHVYLDEYPLGNGLSSDAIELSYNTFLEKCIHAQSV